MYQRQYRMNVWSRFATGMLLFCVFYWSCSSRQQNKLSAASSPYLRAHAGNPVNWLEWGDEALQKAKAENKPLLVSIGYAACHWCHEMEKESFMDTAVARMMNENFICIKVDREERPDIDNIYSTACQLLTGSSGWPLNAFALPDGRPFFAGTYYSKQSWLNLLGQISGAYQHQHNKVVLQAQGIANGVSTQQLTLLGTAPATSFTRRSYEQIFDSISPLLDFNNGGFNGTPKFPAPYFTEFLLQYYYVTGNEKALLAATTTLNKMAQGGIYDQLGGGFSRYATDSLWHIPHFEKMLYDNAQLLSVYAHAYQLTKNPVYKKIIEQTGDFIRRDMKSPEGGYYCSLNADTKEGEGIFYSWTAAAFKRTIAPGMNAIASYYNITEQGNWQENRNILYTTENAAVFANNNNIDTEKFQQELTLVRKQLFEERCKRTPPSADKKILVSWNALMIKGWLSAYTALDDSSYLKNAIDCAGFIENNMIKKDGSLSRSYVDGKVSVQAFLEDYAYLCDAFIQLYQLTFNKRWLDLSNSIAGKAIQKFYSEKDSMFTAVERTTEQNFQNIPLSDNAMPAANAIMAKVLYQLSVYFENKDYFAKSEAMFSRVSALVQKKDAVDYTGWCYLGGLFAFGTTEVAIAGPDALVKNRLLQLDYNPQAIYMGTTAEENLPLLHGKTSGNKTVIYVCTNKMCRAPVEEPNQAMIQLKRVREKEKYESTD